MKIPALLTLILLPIGSLTPVSSESQSGSAALDLAGHSIRIAVVGSLPHPDIPTTEPILSATHLVEHDTGRTMSEQQGESQMLWTSQIHGEPQIQDGSQAKESQAQGLQVRGVQTDKLPTDLESTGELQTHGLPTDELQQDDWQANEQQEAGPTPSALSLATHTSQVPPLFGRLASTSESSSLPFESRTVPSGSLNSRASTAPISTDDFDWPTSSKTVLRGFDHLEYNWLPGHRGVDVASRPDEKIRAAGPGRVVYAGRVVDNNVVSIEHSTGIRTTYLPVDPSVSTGDWVNTGDVIGTIEEGHCLLGTCLHWGAKRGDRYYDPLSLLDAVEIRLYPVSK